MEFTRIENRQKIARIVMKPDAYTICEIGGDMYKSRLEIVFIPDKCYPDYMQVQEWILKEIDGKTLNIEDVVDIVYRKLKEEFSPTAMKITSYIENCRTHFDVIVTKEE